MKTVIVTSREDLNNEVVGNTPPGIPNILVKPMKILTRLAIKVAKVYISSLVAFMGTTLAGALPGTDPVALSNFLHVLANSMELALVPAIGTLILNASIFVTKLDESNPELMA